MTTEAEDIFLDKIDCNFPYQDRQESLKLIDQAITLSTNAVFSVVEELCRIPATENISTVVLQDLLSLIANKFNHPLKDIVLDAANRMVQGQELTVDEVISKMQLIKKHRGQYAALSILYFSCDDKEGALENIWDSILTEWNSIS